MTDTTKNHNPKSYDILAPPYNRHTIRRHKKTTIRVDPELWRKFRDKLQQQGLSSCQVLDALVRVWVHGGAMIPGLERPIKLNYTVEEYVSRRRRVGVKRMEEKRFKGNHYSPSRGWYYDPDLDPGLLLVEQPKEWAGEEKGFRWVEGEQCWYKVEEKPR